MEHLTYNMTFALAAFGEEDGDWGFEVYCCHPEGDDVRLWDVKEIADAEDHMFKIIKREYKDES